MKQKSKKNLMLTFTIIVLIINLACIIQLSLGNITIESVDEVLPITKTSQLIFLSICIIINSISILLISKNFLKHKQAIIILNIIQLFFGNMFTILSGIFNIILCSIKTTDVEEVVKDKKELPQLEDITQYKWYIYFLIFIFLFTICYSPITNILPINNKNMAVISIVALYVIQIISLVMPMWNELKRDFIVFKNNFKLYVSNMLRRFGIILIFYIVCNLFLIYLVGDISTNQYIISQWPVYISALLAIVIAPLTEELMFRGFMKKFIKNDTLFIVISSLIFGGLHVVSSTSINQFLFIIPYSILGLAFALNYIKTRNIASNIFLHSFWNTIAFIAMLITKFI